MLSISLVAQADEVYSDTISYSSVDAVSNEPLEYEDSLSSEPVEKKPFDEEKWKKITKGYDYSTKQAAPQNDDSKGNNNSTKWSPKLSNIGASTIAFLKVLFWVVVLGAFGLLIFFVAKRYYGTPRNFSIKNSDVEVHDFIPENIAELNLEAMLAAALAEGKHKEAVRLYFLIILKDLDERKHIVLKKNSLNRDFLQQMSKRKNYLAFQKVTLLFERVWYGDIELSIESFPQVESVFKDFIELNKIKKA